MTIRTLILSGGGGRGAFHAGVYSYLSELHKDGLDAEHSGLWRPDVIVGTSIGAVNGAAIAQGITADDLVGHWLALREHHVEGLPPGMRGLTRFITNFALKRFLGVKLPRVDEDKALSPAASESWPPLPLLPRRLSERLIGRWNNLLDTAPLYHTLAERWGINETALSASDCVLLISATNVSTGELTLFSNKPILSRKTGRMRDDLRTPITVKRIVASCSIPLVYPWTQDGDGVYWDGAVVSNTPMGAALDAVADRPMDEPMEVVVVLMTPWWEHGEAAPERAQRLPGNFGEAITWTLDWALLASFRERLKMTEVFNGMAEEQIAAGLDQTYRKVNVVIVAPQDFLPVTRIIDYDEVASRELLEVGYQAAARIFQEQFPG